MCRREGELPVNHLLREKIDSLLQTTSGKVRGSRRVAVFGTGEN